MTVYVTPVPWHQALTHMRYGSPRTYELAADWLSACATVADWGGGTGHLQAYLPTTTTYTVVDGTQQTPGQVLADLTQYHQLSEGIALRHVLDMTADWEPVLTNALRSFQVRMVVVTFTGDAEDPVEDIKLKSGWPMRRFNPTFLCSRMDPFVVRHEAVQTSHPERVFYLERPCAS